MPENAIVSDEGATGGLAAYLCTEQAPAHDWLTLTGGAIGQGLPLALGAALACPERKVIALQADGSAMYTIQALWSMARENADVTVVLLNNKSYAILNIELARVGAGDTECQDPVHARPVQSGHDFASIADGPGRAGDAGANQQPSSRSSFAPPCNRGSAPDRGHRRLIRDGPPAGRRDALCTMRR
jgi:acetolactate synthase-1/2/3 large subunit